MFCGLSFLISTDIIAQYEGNKNYELFQDEFNFPGRTWDEDTYFESKGEWRAFFKGTGLTHGISEHQAYQRSQAVFDDTNEMMLLVADYVSDINLSCDDLEIPAGANCKIDDTYSIRYLSGALESINKEFLYGYFEIRCKIPVHKGAFPAFWLWGQCREENTNCEDPHYEEIDIFEYTWEITKKENNPDSQWFGDDRCYTLGMYYNETGDIENLQQNKVAKKRSRLSDDEPSMGEWNTFGCLWMPDKVEWYINDRLVNSYYNPDSSPHHELYLIANYAIDNHVRTKITERDYDYDMVNDTMYIDYIRAYQPIWHCGQDVLIETQFDLNNYEYGVKKSVTISSDDNETPVYITANDNINIMASEYVVIDGPFEIADGAEFMIAIQKCP